MSIGFHSQRISRILRSFRSPSFSVDINSRIHLIHRLTDFIHCLDIMNTHQVETKSVNMIFIHPIKHRLNHILTHHRTIARRFITTSRAVCQCSVFLMAIEISRRRTLKITISGIECMIIHYIKHHPYTRLM